MSSNTIITRSKGGAAERTVKLAEIQIPDLWNITSAIRDGKKVQHGPYYADLISDCWNLCHDLKNHIEDQPD